MVRATLHVNDQRQPQVLSFATCSGAAASLRTARRTTGVILAALLRRRRTERGRWRHFVVRCKYGSDGADDKHGCLSPGLLPPLSCRLLDISSAFPFWLLALPLFVPDLSSSLDVRRFCSDACVVINRSSRRASERGGATFFFLYVALFGAAAVLFGMAAGAEHAFLRVPPAIAACVCVSSYRACGGFAPPQRRGYTSSVTRLLAICLCFRAGGGGRCAGSREKREGGRGWAEGKQRLAWRGIHLLHRVGMAAFLGNMSRHLASAFPAGHAFSCTTIPCLLSLLSCMQLLTSLGPQGRTGWRRQQRSEPRPDTCYLRASACGLFCRAPVRYAGHPRSGGEM